MSKLARGSVAEFIGMFAFVFFGSGAIIMAGPDIGAGSLVTVALAHGLVMALFVTGSMYISGGQFNPAVSIGLLVIGKQSPQQAFTFIAAQLLGAACASGLLVYTLGRDVADHEAVRMGATLGSLNDAGNIKAVFILETVMTFMLMFIILVAVVDKRAHKLGGFCVGMAIAACIVAFGPLTGASMNPARSFGPALYGHWDMHWVYWAAPMVGAVLASVAYKVFWTEEGDEG